GLVQVRTSPFHAAKFLMEFLNQSGSVAEASRTPRVASSEPAAARCSICAPANKVKCPYDRVMSGLASLARSHPAQPQRLTRRWPFLAAHAKAPLKSRAARAWFRSAPNPASSLSRSACRVGESVDRAVGRCGRERFG